MTGQQILDAVSVVGSFLSLAGVLVAIFQIRKTRRAAEAAERASQQAQQGIARNVLLVDVTSCVSQLSAIKAMIRAKKFDAALLRVEDLSANLVQLREVAPRDQRPVANYKKALAQLGILRDLLEERLHNENTAVNPVQINNTLSELSTDLNSWIGGAKFLPTEDAKNG